MLFIRLKENKLLSDKILKHKVFNSTISGLDAIDTGRVAPFLQECSGGTSTYDHLTKVSVVLVPMKWNIWVLVMWLSKKPPQQGKAIMRCVFCLFSFVCHCLEMGLLWFGNIHLIKNPVEFIELFLHPTKAIKTIHIQ